ncbi:hypothetical protein GCM10007925_24820 [Sphingomonas astaxanthinifaciens DSM 22298]|uniref:Uncharacterized protein n=1 Tax=Sphingomonas astaxanthinifaciens DSM 22298 TaxID=1123267 RepID=A0ABQ5ZB97_9SPHN|nr:hypothetical protein GCM10007925_24820 [Sphingomonas astaxanthinifaciens DSM 22298]
MVKTRWEAWAVTWAIALGAVERGKHYLALYPGNMGWVFFAVCCAVVFLAGAKLLDATRPEPAQVPVSAGRRPLQRPRRPLSRSRPMLSRRSGGSASRPSRRTD